MNNKPDNDYNGYNRHVTVIDHEADGLPMNLQNHDADVTGSDQSYRDHGIDALQHTLKQLEAALDIVLAHSQQYC